MSESFVAKRLATWRDMQQALLAGKPEEAAQFVDTEQFTATSLDDRGTYTWQQFAAQFTAMSAAFTAKPVQDILASAANETMLFIMSRLTLEEGGNNYAFTAVSVVQFESAQANSRIVAITLTSDLPPDTTRAEWLRNAKLPYDAPNL
jgi:maltooligosyltrehalose synthase